MLPSVWEKVSRYHNIWVSKDACVICDACGKHFNLYACMYIVKMFFCLARPCCKALHFLVDEKSLHVKNRKWTEQF